MPISVQCPHCSKAFKVKDESAGKKFRCKECGGVVTVPAAESEADPWDNLGDDLSAGDDIDESELPPARSPARKAKRTRSRGAGMPLSVMVAVGCLSLLVLFNFAELVLGLIGGDLRSTFKVGFRLLAEIAIVVGIIQGRNGARWTAIVLCGLGLTCSLACSGILLAAGPNLPPEAQEQFPPELRRVIIAMMLGYGLLMGGIVVSLLMPSARTYFEKK